MKFRKARILNNDYLTIQPVFNTAVYLTDFTDLDPPWKKEVLEHGPPTEWRVTVCEHKCGTFRGPLSKLADDRRLIFTYEGI